MKHLFWLSLYFLTCILLFACNSGIPKNKAIEIVHRSIEEHGGMDHWKNIESIRFRKETSLFNADGTLEKESDEIHTLYQRDTLHGYITSIDSTLYPGLEKAVDPSASYIIKFADGVGMKINKDTVVNATNAFLASHFVINQPFKLLDPDIELSYEGIDTLSSGKIVDVVKAYYGDPKDDIWWFYFDKENHRIVANLIYHDPTYALVVNEETIEKQGFLWNTKRTTYRTDSLRNIEYVRAKFNYEFLGINFTKN